MTLIILLGVILIILVLMVLRFVYPELIYSIREASVEVDIARAFISKNPDASIRLNEAQIKDMRFEISRFDDEYVRERISNIKKLYHLSKPRKFTTISREHRANTTQLCIVELANLLSISGQHIEPHEQIRQPLCVAEEILTMIANEIRKKRGSQGSAITTDTVQTWFEKNPATIEQILELLSSALYAISYRGKFQIEHREAQLTVGTEQSRIAGS